jgi:DUF971 family protein
VHLVGRYAIGVDWQDGHSSIYPFDLLRAGCPCPACRAAADAAVPLPEAASWPVEIKKEGSGLSIGWQDGHVTMLGGAELRARCRCASCAAAAR